MDSVKKWFKTEAAEVKASVSDVGQKLDADIAKREREMNMSPQEKIDAIQGEISDDPFAAARDKIEGAESRALADEELAATASEATAEVNLADASAADQTDPTRDLAAAEETIATAHEASRAEEILRNLNKEVRGES